MGNKIKEPSLLRQWLSVLYERALMRRSLRLLAKQEWSIDFLTSLLIKAANRMKQPLEMVIQNRNGQSIIIRSVDTVAPQVTDNIFDNLDDEFKVQQFIREVNRK